MEKVVASACTQPEAGGTGQSSKLVHTFGVDDYDEYWRSRGLRKATRRVYARIAKVLSGLHPPPARMLELGPGPGQFFHAMMAAGYEMYAVDASSIVIENLKAPAERVRLADLNKGLPGFGVRFHVIVAAKVLHHIDDPGGFLLKLRAALEDKGYLILTIPNIVTLKNRLRFLAGRFPKLSASHKNFMTPQETAELLRRSGYNVLRLLSARRKLLSAAFPVLYSNELILVCQATA